MPLCILIADDSATNRMLFSMTIKRMGHEADVVATGDEATNLFSQKQYDLVFLDLNMPLTDGIGTARKILPMNKRGIPVYAITGFATKEQEAAFAGAGIRRGLIKPLDREKLLEIMKECGLKDEPGPMPATREIPQKLLGTYARELRSRVQACQRYLAEENGQGLMREAHTIRALGQMLKTPEVEIAAAALERSEKEKRSALVEVLCAACTRTADTIEKKLPMSG